MKIRKNRLVGADSDGVSLSDWEGVEVYGSDPLKVDSDIFPCLLV